MMSEGQPYIAIQNVYIVPVVRNRLNFCILFKRAFEELRLGDGDLIAVEIPSQIRDLYLECVSDFPTVSILLTSNEDGATQEVFTVTPCDAVAEATRTSVEAGIDVEFIDQSMSPRQLEKRQCIESPAWPDDGLVLINGADWYLSQVGDLIAVPPARSDPMDSWRESFMARRLQELAPWYQRIVVVCDLVHAKPLVARLQLPPDTEQVDRDQVGGLRVRRMRPSLPHLLRSLDDMPRLVELYQGKRHDASSFWKMREILKAVHVLASSAHDMNFSIRNYEAFATLLTKMSECQRRLSPSLEDVRLAGVSCFNDAFGERIFRHLLGYFDDVKVGRVKALGLSEPNDSMLYELRTVPSSAPEYAVRSCSPWLAEYEIEIEPRVKEDYRRGSGGDFEVAWPLCDRFADEMRRKAHRVLTTDVVETKSVRFRGSIEEGIDMRRTLRSQLWKGSDGLASQSGPEFYVRKVQRIRSDGYPWEREPIVWIFDAPSNVDMFAFSIGTGGGGKTGQSVLDWRFSEKHEEVKSADLSVRFENTIGYLAFAELTSTGQQLRDAFGPDLSRRVPPESEFIDDLEIGGNLAFGPRALDDIEFAIESWWEALILAGLLYCESRLICVAPANLRIPSRVLGYANLLRKKVHRVALGAFEPEEQRKLGVQYWVDGRWKPPFDSNDPKFHDFLILKHGDFMTQYWGASTATEPAR